VDTKSKYSEPCLTWTFCVSEGGFNITLTIQLLLYGKEVGSIIGKKESVKKMCEENEGNCSERIINLSGPTNAIVKDFAMIADKLQEEVSSSMANSTVASRLQSLQSLW
uniref:K Homology domain-containing protein n=1 Tax=Sarcophilus harrisii TaxID=9305 RepID=A0A7N4P835_SARHA